ncbi:hypothetical protein GCM10022403_080190 [Streptomyces coacervatus]|uniref:Uncharacterized protein n=1 Tax=Streptomyces coacervatus TaxID=647381 RepID=A0ABP7J5M1_9ACTN|nr:hypothetical protein [Streptomyces coacervatus]MDF2269397.1 hypothetical protein [Streptomyces coacervatus]
MPRHVYEHPRSPSRPNGVGRHDLVGGLTLTGIGSAEADSIQQHIASQTSNVAHAVSGASAASSGWYDCNERTGTWHDKNTAGGFCNGKGPHWSYQTHAQCKDGTLKSGARRWAGDTRWSYAYCAGHRGLRQAWVNMYYDGQYRAKSMDIL